MRDMSKYRIRERAYILNLTKEIGSFKRNLMAVSASLFNLARDG